MRVEQTNKQKSYISSWLLVVIYEYTVWQKIIEHADYTFLKFYASIFTFRYSWKLWLCFICLASVCPCSNCNKYIWIAMKFVYGFVVSMECSVFKMNIYSCFTGLQKQFHYIMVYRGRTVYGVFYCYDISNIMGLINIIEIDYNKNFRHME